MIWWKQCSHSGQLGGNFRLTTATLHGHGRRPCGAAPSGAARECGRHHGLRPCYPHSQLPRGSPGYHIPLPAACRTHPQRVGQILLLQHRFLSCSSRLVGIRRGAVLPHRDRAVAAARGQQIARGARQGEGPHFIVVSIKSVDALCRGGQAGKDRHGRVAAGESTAPAGACIQEAGRAACGFAVQLHAALLSGCWHVVPQGAIRGTLLFQIKQPRAPDMRTLHSLIRPSAPADTSCVPAGIRGDGIGIRHSLLCSAWMAKPGWAPSCTVQSRQVRALPGPGTARWAAPAQREVLPPTRFPPLY